MPLAKSHSLPNKKDRKAKKAVLPNGYTNKEATYNEVEVVLDKVYADICNGASRSDVIQKLVYGLYDNDQIGKRQAQNYYNAALDRFAVDTDIEAERLRNLFYGRYEALLEEAIKKGDLYNARGILDSMSRIFGVERKTPDTAIQINSDKEGGVTVNFGFKDEN